jgi:hypothetical protein
MLQVNLINVKCWALKIGEKKGGEELRAESPEKRFSFGSFHCFSRSGSAHPRS